MPCSSCQKDNPDGHKFCSHCGQPLSVTCGACGTANEPDHNFCGQCGTSLKETRSQPPKEDVSEAERRQLTVMFCDLVGSTAMSEIMDPEDLRDVLSTYQEACKKHINRYGGYIARYMGDGLLVYFGYPTAHERDPERAVRAGLDIVTDVSSQTLNDGTPLHVRVGIATGLVVVGDLIGEGASEERAVLGETPNLAARLQGLAEPGSVVVSQSTYGLLSNRLAFQDLGPQSLKGISDQVHAFRALGETVLENEASNKTRNFRLVGRTSELEQLHSLWHRASQGFGHVAILSGDAGLGKSHLLAAFEETIDFHAATRIEIKASEFHQDSSLRPVRQMLEAHLRNFDSGFTDNASRALTGWLSSFENMTSDAPGIFCDFLGLSSDDVSPHNLDGAALKIRTFDCLVQLFEEISAKQPLLIIVEDAQWLDASTQEFLGRVVNRIPSMKSLLVVACRPSFTANWNATSDFSKITLTRLSDEEASQIIDQVEGSGALSDTVRASLIEHADGIPLYVEELTRSALEAGLGAVENADIAVPTSLQDSLMARLDRLGPTKLVAQKAAVIGRILDRKILHEISDQDSVASERGLLELLSADLLIPRTDLSEGLFEFRHAMIRDIAYQSLLKRRRKQIHSEIAKACLRLYPEIEQSEPELIAFHYTEAELPELALPLWRAAAESATARWANVEAISYYNKALTSLRLANPDDAHQEVELLVGLVGCMRIVDRFDDAFAALARAEELATSKGFDLLLTRLLSLHGNLCFPVGDLKSGIAFHTQARDLARKLDNTTEEAKAEGGLGDAAMFLAQVHEAEAHYNTCIEIARRENLPGIELANLSVRGHMRLYLNKTTEALADCLESTDLAVKANNRRAEMIARGSCLSKVYYEMGEWQKSGEQSARAKEIAEALGALRYIPMYTCFQAKAALAVGETEKALEFASRAVEFNRQSEFVYTMPMTLSTLARTLDSADEADRILAEGEAMLDQSSLGHNHFWYRFDAMELGLQRNDQAMVEHHAVALEHFTANEPLAWADFHIQRCRLLVQIKSGNTDELTRTLISTLIDEAKARGQQPAAESLQAGLG